MIILMTLPSHVYSSMPCLNSNVGNEDVASLLVSVEHVCTPSFNKLSKADGSILVSEHLILCLPVVVESISQLFTAMLRHSFMPKLLQDCVLVPFPKSGKDPDSYQAVVLVPTLSKALEWVLYPDQFSTSDLQFGFKCSISTFLCTGPVKNVASRYEYHSSHVYNYLPARCIKGF